MLETVKLAEDGDGFIVRLYETDNAKTKAVLTWNLPSFRRRNVTSLRKSLCNNHLTAPTFHLKSNLTRLRPSAFDHKGGFRRLESAAGTRQEETAMDFLPAPHILRYGEGIFAMEYSTRITLTDTEPSALLYAGMLRETIETETGLCLPVFRGAAGEGDIILRMDAALRADTYRLSVSPLGAAVLAGGGEALCHGVQTLRQWIERNGARLPAIEIEDWPDLPNRGYYLDVSRGRVPTLETLKRYADLLCRYKINEWQLYVEHTYLFAGLSEAWRDDTPLTAGEIMELDAYCRDRCIELVPSLSTFGHMYKILSTKTCCDLCELENSEKIPFSYTYAGDHHTLNVSNPRALDFIKGMITEYMQLFTSRKFNICADETFDLGKGRSQGLAREAGERALYMNHVKALCEFVVEQGRTPLFWGDIVWRYKDAYAMLPKETICLNWGYLPNQREDEIRTLAEIGATQYVCPGVCTWNRWVPLIRDSFNNNRAMCGHGRKYGAVGPAQYRLGRLRTYLPPLVFHSRDSLRRGFRVECRRDQL